MAVTLQPSDLVFEFASNGMDDIHQVTGPGEQSPCSPGWEAGRRTLRITEQAPTVFRVPGPLANQSLTEGPFRVNRRMEGGGLLHAMPSHQIC